MDSAKAISPEEVGQLQKVVSLQHEEIGYLREQLRLLKHQMFGPKTDRIRGLDQQLPMFDDTIPPQAATEDEPSGEVKGYQRKKPGRKPIPETLPREHVYHDIAEADKACGCGAQLIQIGEETSKRWIIYRPNSR